MEFSKKKWLKLLQDLSSLSAKKTSLEWMRSQLMLSAKLFKSQIYDLLS